MTDNGPDGTPVRMPVPAVREQPAREVAGWLAGILALAAVPAGAGLIAGGSASGSLPVRIPLIVTGVVLILSGAVLAAGLTAVAPGEARVVQLLGRYTGTLRTSGLRWVNPLAARHRISTRIRNHETGAAKVNDADGNPVEIAAVVVWQVEDTAKARFGVDDFVRFVGTQAETAVRHIAGIYPYDSGDKDQLSLRDNAAEVTAQLSAEIAERVAPAGVTIIESRLTRLSYAPEIAQAMLRRQQASAVVAARERIVQGAVGMVESALTRLAEDGVVELDEERRAAMVSNMLVVLCSEQATQPVINTGTLYQ
jgi:regulator of protease activity HflC (stomatin/prohibitin superfamily)